MTSWFSRPNLENKLIRLNLIAFGSASVIGAVIIVSYFWISARSDLLQNAEVTAQVVAQNSAPAFLFLDNKSGSEVIKALEQDRNILRANLYLPDKHLFASYQRPNISDRDSEKNLLPLADGSTIRSQFFRSQLSVLAPVTADGQVLGFLQIDIDLSATYTRLFNLIGVVFLGAALAIFVAWRLLNRSLREVLQPIQALVDAMHEVSSNDNYAQRKLKKSDDEIGELIDSFNFMLEQIQRRDTALSKELLERKRAEIKLDHIAHYDSVTGLPNRHYYIRHTSDLISAGQIQGRNYALLFIDVDNFKYVNDTFGHHGGDLLLVSVAVRLQENIRSHDLVVRLGGDEFCVLLDNPKSLEDAMRIANKLLNSLNATYICDDHEYNVGASIGVAMIPDHASKFDDLLIFSDAAMYTAKANGKNCVQCWTPDMSKRTAQRFTIESGLRKAIENNELEVYYQPIMHLASNTIAGMEALLRWKHPVLGFVSPAEFIPVAEESQLIVSIGEWVLQQACTQAVKWEQQFGKLFIAVNVSARQFRDPNFANTVEQIVEATGCRSDMLELELTETMLMSQTSETLAILEDLNRRGFLLSLDDFGTGYSSLAYLKRFPIDKLKIDRSFVSALPNDLDDAAIAQVIVSLSTHMGMSVVAEGIETSAQAAFLKDLNCTYGQGFLFSPPLPAGKFEDFVKKSRA